MRVLTYFQHHYPLPIQEIHFKSIPIPNLYTRASSFHHTVTELDYHLLPVTPTADLPSFLLVTSPLSSESVRSNPPSIPDKSSCSSNNAGEHCNFPHRSDALYRHWCYRLCDLPPAKQDDHRATRRHRKRNKQYVVAIVCNIAKMTDLFY